MRWWNEQAMPRLADRVLRGRAIGELRDQACEGLSGRVLEIGFGGGLNVRSYPAGVTDVHAVEPSDVAWRLSERRRARSTVPVTRTGLDGQRIDEPDAAYDAVLCTFTLCTIPDVESALAEVRRVLRPGGRLHFLEHGLSPDPGVARLQRRLNGLQRRFAGGCQLVRVPEDLVTAAGLRVDDLQHTELPGPKVGRAMTYLSWGRASLTA